MWCDKRVEDREMDVVFAQVVAEALSQSYTAGLEAGRQEVLAKWPEISECCQWLADNNISALTHDSVLRSFHDWLRNRLTIVNKDENEL